MQAVGIKTALACILFGFSSLGPGGHFQADEGVSLRRDAGGHFATEFPATVKTLISYLWIELGWGSTSILTNSENGVSGRFSRQMRDFNVASAAFSAFGGRFRSWSVFRQHSVGKAQIALALCRGCHAIGVLSRPGTRPSSAAVFAITEYLSITFPSRYTANPFLPLRSVIPP